MRIQKSTVEQDIEALEKFLANSSEEEIKAAAHAIFEKVKANAERMQDNGQVFARRYVAVMDRVKEYLKPETPQEAEERIKNLTFDDFDIYKYKEKGKPLVTVAVSTYNHAKFIKTCLNSILMQKTNFSFEILVHDDASTDGTQEIIKEFEQKYPNTIKPIYQKENQFSKNVIFSNFHFERVRSKYLVISDGDDYFIDENKLQTQVNFMESNSDYSITFHPVFTVWENREQPNSIFPSIESRFNKITLDMEDLLKQNFIQTNSIMYRWAFYGKNYVSIFSSNFSPKDWYLHLYHAQYGKIGFIDKCMGVYRRHENGIWSGNPWVRHGIKHLNFFEAVYNNIAKDKDAYLKTISHYIFTAYQTFIDNNLTESIEFTENHPMWSKLVEHIKTCYICRKSFPKFNRYNISTFESISSAFTSTGRKELNTVGSDTINFSCPYCTCHDRERHFFAYFDKLSLWPKENYKILHFAPENYIYKKINLCKPKEYIKADWEPELYVRQGINDVMKINLMDITFSDNYFDIVICNHVLEHVSDMQKCLTEIHRVLKKGSFAILQTPYSRLLHKHFEDAGIKTNEQKTLFYGQSDHVRIVSEKQFFEDLKTAGFELDIIKHSDLFDDDFAKTYGVNPVEDLIKVVKK